MHLLQLQAIDKILFQKLIPVAWFRCLQAPRCLVYHIGVDFCRIRRCNLRLRSVHPGTQQRHC